jgi:hypothetical protein
VGVGLPFVCQRYKSVTRVVRLCKITGFRNATGIVWVFNCTEYNPEEARKHRHRTLANPCLRRNVPLLLWVSKQDLHQDGNPKARLLEETARVLDLKEIHDRERKIRGCSTLEGREYGLEDGPAWLKAAIGWWELDEAAYRESSLEKM